MASDRLTKNMGSISVSPCFTRNIPEGKVFPERVLIVGSPGKVVRELTDDEVARLPGSAERYVQNWQRYQRELTEI